MCCFNKNGFIGCLLLISILNTNAQNVVSDLLNGKNLEFERKYTELNKMDITYPIIK